VRLGSTTKINPSKKEISHISDELGVSFIPMMAVNEEIGKIVNLDSRKLGKIRKRYTYF